MGWEPPASVLGLPMLASRPRERGSRRPPRVQLPGGPGEGLRVWRWHGREDWASGLARRLRNLKE